MKLRVKTYYFFIFILVFFLGCTSRSRVPLSRSPSGVQYIQFGSWILIKDIRKGALRIEGAGRVEKVSRGWLIKPEKECLRVFTKDGSKRLCLKSVPPVYPHLKVLRVDSYALDLQVLSLFPRLALFVWEKGKDPDFENPRRISPGVHSLRGLSLGKTYLLSAAVTFGPDIYGPLSQPLEVKMEDTEPPLPPSGGGYFLKGNTLVLVWDPSPSRDVVGYVVEREGKLFKVKKNMFQERDGLKGVVLYNIKALDGAGHESSPLLIKVVFPEEGENEGKPGEK